MSYLGRLAPDAGARQRGVATPGPSEGGEYVEAKELGGAS